MMAGIKQTQIQNYMEEIIWKEVV